MKRVEFAEIIFDEILSRINRDEVYDGDMVYDGFNKIRKEFTTEEGIKQILKENLKK